LKDNMANGPPVHPAGNLSPNPDATSAMADRTRLARGSLKQRIMSASAWVVFGQLATQAMRFAGNLVLTRLLIRDDFGLMLSVTVVLQIAQMFSDVGLRVSVVRHARGDQERFLNTAWTIQVIRGLGLWIILTLLAWPISLFYEQPELVQLIPVVGLTTILYGVTSTAQYTLNRHVRFGRQVTVQLLAQAFSTALMIAVAWYTRSVWALAAGAVFHVAFLCIASHWLIPNYRNRFAWDSQAAGEIFHFGKWITLSTILHCFLIMGDKAVMSKMLSTADAGVFAIAVLISDALLLILRRLSHEVLLPVYSRLADSDDAAVFRGKIMRLRMAVLGLSLPPIWIAAVFAQPLIDFLYPDQYAQAGEMLRILAMGSVGTVIFLSAERVTLAKGDSFRAMIVQALRAVLLLGGMVIGGQLGGPMGVLWGVAGARLADYLVLVWAIRRYNAWLPALDALAFALSAAVIGLGMWLV